jgi:hypothetical protein
MPGGKAVKDRIEHLIAKAPELSAPNGHSDQVAWLISAEYAVQLVCSSSVNPYYRRAHELVLMGQRQAPKRAISGMAALLKRLLEEIEGGLLTTIENRAIALTFDDFLDHGAEYLKHGRKDEAAVIAGIVFEDTIRRICRVLEMAENGAALETLISDLAKRDPPILTSLEAKRARAAAGLRTSAAHARWEEIKLGDVNPVIEFTRELMAAHLG